MKRMIKGGRVVSSHEIREADICIEDGIITQVGKIPEGETDGYEVMDASGMLIFPGFIDVHTHFDLHVAGTVTADDFLAGTRAAIAGGTTTIVDFATQYPGETLEEGLSNWHKKADGKCSCDYGFHMSITDWNPQVSEEIQKMMEEGVSTFKLYMTYDTQVDDKTIYQILCRLAEEGGITGVHCENSGLIEALQEEAASQGRMGTDSHPATRPAGAEAEAISRLLRLAEAADAPVMVVHLTCEEGLKEIRQARARGQVVYAETCPQYLLMDDSLYDLPDFAGARYVIAPPLRKKRDQEVLWKALKDGEIQTISTDHCSFTLEQKRLGEKDFRKIPGGMPGAETRGILMYSEGVAAGRLTPEDLCRLLSENPARLYGMYPEKGAIRPGSHADLVILDPEAEDVITAASQHSLAGYAPFEGLKVKGKIRQVYLRGELAAENGQVVKELAGRYVARKAPSVPVHVDGKEIEG